MKFLSKNFCIPFAFPYQHEPLRSQVKNNGGISILHNTFCRQKAHPAFIFKAFSLRTKFPTWLQAREQKREKRTKDTPSFQMYSIYALIIIAFPGDSANSITVLLYQGSCSPLPLFLDWSNEHPTYKNFFRHEGNCFNQLVERAMRFFQTKHHVI
jgi:hypothetical protein